MNLSSINLRFFANVAPLISGLNKAERAMQQSGRQMQKLGGSLSLKLTAPIAAFGAVSINAFKDFELEMAKVKAVSGATGAEFESLRDNALELGRSTIFTAAEVANLQTEYAKLGFTSAQIEGVTEATLALAQATDTELARSAEVVGSTLRAFQLDVSQTSHVTDVMALSFSSSALDMEKFAESMKYVAPVANSAGLSIEETTAMIGLLADAGITGSQAGTSLRRIISDLGAGSEPVTEKIKQLAHAGLNLADAKDEVGRNAQSALLILAGASEKIDPMTASLKEANGSAQEMADTMSDTSYGALMEFQSAWEGLKIQMGESLAVAFLPIVEALSNVMLGFQAMPESIQTTLMIILGLTAAVGPLVWLIGSLKTAFVALRGATILSTFATATWGAVVAIATSPITLIVAAIAALAAIILYCAYNFEALRIRGVNALRRLANSGIESLNYLIRKFNDVAGFLSFGFIEVSTVRTLTLEDETGANFKTVGETLDEIKDDLGMMEEVSPGVTQELGKLTQQAEDLNLADDELGQDSGVAQLGEDAKNTKKAFLDLNSEYDRLMSLQAQFNKEHIRMFDEDFRKDIEFLDAAAMGLEEINDMDFEDAPVFEDVPKGFAKIKIAALELARAVNDAMRQMAVDTIVGLSEMAGAMVMGQATFADFGAFIIGQFANLFSEIGKMFVEYGLAQSAFSAAVQTMNGPAAIAAGVALLALGGIMKAKMNSMSAGQGIPALAEGGIVTGPTLALIGEGRGPEAVIPLDKLNGMMSGGGQRVTVTGRISGSDILLSNERATRERSRYRGY